MCSPLGTKNHSIAKELKKEVQVIREQSQGGDPQEMSLRGTWELEAKWETKWPPFLEQSKWGESESHSAMSNSFQPHGLYKSMEFSRPKCWSG